VIFFLSSRAPNGVLGWFTSISFEEGLIFHETFSIYFKLVLPFFSLSMGWRDVSAWFPGGIHGAV
jgi:hypothetical protein